MTGETKKCPYCGEEILGDAIKCKHCREFLGEVRRIETAREKTWYEKNSVTLAVAAVLVPVLAVFGLGFIHIITGSNLDSPFRIEYKDSFGLGETFINVDKITGMPWMFAKAKYPIGCKVLQEHGYIESDNTMEKRIKREFKRELKESAKELEEMAQQQ